MRDIQEYWAKIRIMRAGGFLPHERVENLDDDIKAADAAKGPPQDAQEAEQRRQLQQGQQIRRMVRKTWP